LGNILVILHAPADQRAAEDALAGLPRLHSQYISWNHPAVESLIAERAELVIAFHPADGGNCAPFLRLLRAKGCAPVMAVLPRDAPAALFQVAFETAGDVVIQPLHTEEFRQRIARLLRPNPAQPADMELGLNQLIGTHPAFLETARQIPTVARADAPVLITGETGTGKELCARAIHNLSRRRDGPFIAVDCGAIPESLFESEFFGHARGAFTDARVAQQGLAALADTGTLFLDEVDTLPLSCQAKLLRFLQDHAYRPLGSDRFQSVDVNVISATNGDVDACVQAGRLRADLVFRIDVLRLQLPALRDRKTDIPLLARHFLDELAARSGSPAKSLSAAALHKLSAHGWPGNVRELFNVLRRAAVLSDGPFLLPEHITSGNPSRTQAAASSFRQARSQAIEAFERSYVEQLLLENDGNVTRAAQQANKDRRAFGRLAKRYQIDPRSLRVGHSRAALG
jgi:DNA-binding NtrC family response regulator